MSAILSADDLNDFISPGVACIKPIETLPEKPDNKHNPYEVTTEDALAAANPAPPAQISLTDCLACSGCVTSAEAVLVSLQSHTEVLNTLDAYPSMRLPGSTAEGTIGEMNGGDNAKIFVATVSPQTRASLAATYGISERRAGNLIAQLLAGEHGLRSGGARGSHFTWVLDTNIFREMALVLAAEEVIASLGDGGDGASAPKKPILTSACPGWICYAEKTHPHVLPHLSALKSPQALAGTLVKSILAKRLGVPPSNVWHLAVMPCFDKKLEASRSELTSAAWLPSVASADDPPVRDVDCVITAREIVSLAVARGINLRRLPSSAAPQAPPFPDPVIDTFLFPRHRPRKQDISASTSGGYLYHALATLRARNPGSEIRAERGRNADVVEYSLFTPGGVDGGRENHGEEAQGTFEGGREIIRAARFYGFRNIQNLVRRLKPARASRMPGAAARRPHARAAAGGSGAGVGADYVYAEVMACPGGCTNGGGQVRVGEVGELRGEGGAVGAEVARHGPKEQREWLARVDEAYFSAESEEEDEVGGGGGGAMNIDGEEERIVNGVDTHAVRRALKHWAEVTGVELERLVKTTYRAVESDVGKKKGASDVERVAGLASSLGGGW